MGPGSSPPSDTLPDQQAPRRPTLCRGRYKRYPENLRPPGWDLGRGSWLPSGVLSYRRLLGSADEQADDGQGAGRGSVVLGLVPLGGQGGVDLAVSRSARVASWAPVGCLTGYWTWAGSSMSENDWGPDLKVWSIFWPLMVPVKWKL
jgi:hypothetical protein